MGDYFRLDDFIRSTPKTLEASRALANGIEMSAILFGPNALSEYTCSLAIWFPSEPATEPQYASISHIKSVSSALAKVNGVARLADEEDPRAIFGLMGRSGKK